MVLRLQVEYSLSCNSVANLLIDLFKELLVGMNGQLTERRETEFVEKRRKFCTD